MIFQEQTKATENPASQKHWEIERAEFQDPLPTWHHFRDP